MRGIATGFLEMIQQAYLQKAANLVVSSLPFSGGGQVPARVSNGEYVMSKGAVNRYGGGFMHGLNARGKVPGYAGGGPLGLEGNDFLNAGRKREKVHVPGGAQEGSALRTGFGGGEGWASGNLYQKKAMSGFFYSGASGNQLLGEDASTAKGILAERARKAAEKKAKKEALIKGLVQTALTAGLTYGLGSLFSGASGSGPDTSAWGDSQDPSNWSSQEMEAYQFRESQAYGGASNFDGMGQGSQGGFISNWNGGSIRKYAPGGYISGKSGIDQIPAMLSEGEYVIKQSSVQRLGKPMLDRINAGKFADGGPTSPIAEQSETSATGGGNTNNINISVNVAKGESKGSKEDVTGENPSDVQEEDKKNNALAEKLRTEVVTIIVEEQRPGGLLDGK